MESLLYHRYVGAFKRMVVRQDGAVGSHHDIFADNSVFRYPAIDAESAVVSDFNLSARFKVRESLDIDILSAFFENVPAEHASEPFGWLPDNSCRTGRQKACEAVVQAKADE